MLLVQSKGFSNGKSQEKNHIKKGDRTKEGKMKKPDSHQKNRITPNLNLFLN